MTKKKPSKMVRSCSEGGRGGREGEREGGRERGGGEGDKEETL